MFIQEREIGFCSVLSLALSGAQHSSAAKHSECAPCPPKTSPHQRAWEVFLLTWAAAELTKPVVVERHGKDIARKDVPSSSQPEGAQGQFGSKPVAFRRCDGRLCTRLDYRVGGFYMYKGNISVLFCFTLSE